MKLIWLFVFVCLLGIGNAVADLGIGGQAAYYAEEYIDAGYGVAADGGIDMFRVVEQIKSDCVTNLPREHADIGCEIILPPGEFLMSDPIYLDRAYTLTGAGGTGDGARTLLRPDEDESCVRLIHSGEVDGGVGGGASGSVLRGFGCQCDVSSDPSSPAHGVVASTKFFGEQLTMRHCINGFHVEASAVGGSGNTNNFGLQNSIAWNNKHSGIWIRGADTNAGLTLNNDFSSNCADPSLGDWGSTDGGLGTCANLNNMSFLGLTHVADHTASPGDGGINISVGYNAAGVEVPGNESVLVGVYSESQVEQELGPNALALGGSSVFEDNVTHFSKQTMNALAIENRLDPDHIVTVKFGNLASLFSDDPAWVYFEPSQRHAVNEGIYFRQLHTVSDAGVASDPFFLIQSQANQGNHPVKIHMSPDTDDYKAGTLWLSNTTATGGRLRNTHSGWEWCPWEYADGGECDV